MSNAEQLAALRAEIDRIDVALVGLIAERTRVVRRVMVHKTDEESVRGCDRVRIVLDKVRALAEAEEIDPSIAERTYKSLIEALTDMQLEYLRQRQQEA